ncbi:carboxypeptidase-like regulatory domain-containing protein [Ornithinibacillus halophilus]|nr:carboxypeptidase-like regulatory domain-containing protein [Ornithinibacillus halophilus]
MKVKHLVLTVAAMVVLVFLLSVVVLPQIELYVAEKKLANGEAEGKAQLMEAIDSTILPSQRWEKIQEYMIDGDITNRFDLYVGPSMWHGGTRVEGTRFTWKEKLPYLQDYVENGPINGYLATVAQEIASYYLRENNPEKAEEVLLNTADRFAPSQHLGFWNELMIKRIKLAMSYSDFDKAKEYIEEMNNSTTSDDYYVRAEVTTLKAEIIVREGRLEEGYEELMDAMEEYESHWAQEREEWAEEDIDLPINDKIENTIVYEQMESLKRRLERELSNGSQSIVNVSGQVIREDGRPIENAGVFLREENLVNRSIGDDEPYQVLTDENGMFEIEGVVPGSYQVFIGLMFEDIDGYTWPVDRDDWIVIDGSEDIKYSVTLQPLIEIKRPINNQNITDHDVHFAWEEVEGADYYNLNLGLQYESGGGVSVGFKEYISGNETKVPVEEIYNKRVGILMGDEEDYKYAHSVLGFMNPHNQISWSVEAYTKDGKLITRSNGYRLQEKTIGNLPFFNLKGRELTEADQLLLDGKVEQALEMYIEKYEENPDDIHSLQMIPRLIGIKGDGTFDSRQKLALPYTKELAERTGSPDYIYDVADYYYSRNSWDSYNRWYERYMDSVNRPDLSSYNQGNRASALLKQGKVEDSIPLFKEAMKKDNSHRFVGNWLAAELYIGSSFENVLKIAEEYPDRSYIGYREQRTDWVQIISHMEKERQEVPEYQQQLRKVLEMYFQGVDRDIDEWLSSTEEETMKDFVMALKRVDN